LRSFFLETQIELRDLKSVGGRLTHDSKSDSLRAVIKMIR
jgi:hypothetical protein